MTMQHPIHPDDERLAALAGGDPETTRDAGLRAHVDACDRCGPMVAELAQLRSALAELPDLVPSRQIQLVPPVPAVEQPSGGWLRRLAGPMVAAGVGMVLVGAIGTSGVLSSFGGLGGAAAAPSAAREQDSGAVASAGGQESQASSSPRGQPTEDGNYEPERSGSPAFGYYGGGSASPAPPQPASAAGVPADQGKGAGEPVFGPVGSSPLSPWAVILLVGAVLAFAGGTILVAQRAPRAP